MRKKSFKKAVITEEKFLLKSYKDRRTVNKSFCIKKSTQCYYDRTGIKPINKMSMIIYIHIYIYRRPIDTTKVQYMYNMFENFESMHFPIYLFGFLFFFF